MSSDLKAKLAQVAARIAATQERLRGMERSAASLRQDLESLRADVARDEADGPEDEWGHRVPTRPLAVGGVGDGVAAQDAVTAHDGGARAEAATGGGPPSGLEDEPWPDR